MSKSNNTLREEMELIANTYRDAQNFEFTQVIATCKCGRGGLLRLPKHPETHTRTVEQILEVIGEDEHSEFGTDDDTDYCLYRNELRAEQRQALNKLLGEETIRQCSLCIWNGSIGHWKRHMVKIHNWQYYDGINPEPNKQEKGR